MSDVVKPNEPTAAEQNGADLDAVAEFAQAVMGPRAQKARAENTRWQQVIRNAKAAGRLLTVKRKEK